MKHSWLVPSSTPYMCFIMPQMVSRRSNQMWFSVWCNPMIQWAAWFHSSVVRYITESWRDLPWLVICLFTYFCPSPSLRVQYRYSVFFPLWIPVSSQHWPALLLWVLVYVYVVQDITGLSPEAWFTECINCIRTVVFFSVSYTNNCHNVHACSAVVRTCSTMNKYEVQGHRWTQLLNMMPRCQGSVLQAQALMVHFITLSTTHQALW